MPTDLRNKTINGVFWSAVDKFSGLAVQMLCTLVIAHFLTPEDFGIIGMITIFTAIGLIIVDSGFSSALIRRENSMIDYTTVFYVNMLMATFSYIALYFLSPAIAQFYDIPDLTIYSRITFLILPINAVSLIQNTILIKTFKFKSLAKVSVLSAFLSGIIGIYLAWSFKSVWALIIQNVAMYLIRSILLWLVGSWKPTFSFSVESLSSMWGYSSNLLASRFIAVVIQNIYPLVIGKVYDATQLGYYSQADRFQKLPSTSITEVIQRVCFPALSEVQNDLKKMKEVYRKLIKVSFFIICPIMLGLLGCSSNLFMVLLGPQWIVAAKYFKILCIVGTLYPLHCINLNILNVLGKSRLSLYLEITRKAFWILLIAVGMHYPIIYFIWIQVVCSFFELFLNLYFCGKEISYGIPSQLKDILPTLTISLISLLFECSYNLLHIDSAIIGLSLQIAIFSILYFGINHFFKCEAFMETSRIVKELIHKN